jgi:cytidylate kinase
LKFTVAIDGPAAAGKGTISKAVAARFGFAHLDTGLLYRAVGRKVFEGEVPEAAAKSLIPEDISRGDLRTPEVAEAASRVAALPQVRAALVAFQRDFARREGGAVLDGRDIGTVICPDAEVKLYVTASDERRAVRRHKELMERGISRTEAEVLAELKARDARDSERATAPLRPAPDAVLLDTTELSIDEAVERAVAAVHRVLGQEKANRG